MPDGKFTSTERRGLMLLLALLAAGICAVAIVRNCGRTDTAPITVAAPTATDNSANIQTPDGRERSHRDESVIDPPDHPSNSTNHHR